MSVPLDCAELSLPLHTERLVLRPLDPDDLDDMLVLCAHPEICRYIRPPMSRGQTADHIHARLRPWRFEVGAWFSLAVTRPESRRVIGETVFRLESREDRRAEIGYRFHPELQGQGYASEAVGALIGLLFRELDLHRLTAYCDVDNQASLRLLERLGMRVEGRLREQTHRDGVWRDLSVHGLLRREYAALKRPAKERERKTTADKPTNQACPNKRKPRRGTHGNP